MSFAVPRPRARLHGSGDGFNPQHPYEVTMYVKAQIVRVAASSDKCSCGGTMQVLSQATVAE